MGLLRHIIIIIIIIIRLDKMFLDLDVDERIILKMILIYRE
jgi:hypothetical protein